MILLIQNTQCETKNTNKCLPNVQLKRVIDWTLMSTTYMILSEKV